MTLKRHFANCNSPCQSETKFDKDFDYPKRLIPKHLVNLSDVLLDVGADDLMISCVIFT